VLVPGQGRSVGRLQQVQKGLILALAPLVLLGQDACEFNPFAP